MFNVGVGVGIIIINKQNQILLCKRISKHGKGTYSIPGGNIDPGEKIKDSAVREVFEETGLRLHHVTFIGVTNNVMTFKKEGLHTVSLIYFCDNFSGQPIVKEPQKHEYWQWYDLNNLPSPQFEASQLGIKLLANISQQQSYPHLLEG
jgi:mutator protein MutT